MTLPPGIVGTGSYDESVTRERLLAWRLANHHLAATRTGDPAQLVADVYQKWIVGATPTAAQNAAEWYRFNQAEAYTRYAKDMVCDSGNP